MRDVLATTKAQKLAITDTASAFELNGYQPTLIHSAKTNIKITTQEDLKLANYFLEHLC
jgi:2-C-methyl-D-erythritol 4-phosphate cytidylyltransferase